MTVNDPRAVFRTIPCADKGLCKHKLAIRRVSCPDNFAQVTETSREHPNSSDNRLAARANAVGAGLRNLERGLGVEVMPATSCEVTPLPQISLLAFQLRPQQDVRHCSSAPILATSPIAAAGATILYCCTNHVFGKLAFLGHCTIGRSVLTCSLWMEHSRSRVHCEAVRSSP